MESGIRDMLFSLLRYELRIDEAPPLTPQMLSASDIECLYKLSMAHDVAHLIGHALLRLSLLGEGPYRSAFEKQQFLALYRAEQMKAELSALKQVLEAEGIPFLPLKGSVIRPLYPEGWMRTSCDIDVLVHEEDRARATECLVRALGYTLQQHGSHDDNLKTPNGGCVELHHSLNEPDFRSYDMLTHIWDYATPIGDGRCECVLPDDVLYTYHMAHMAKHVWYGGCGIRPLMDTWMLRHRVAFDAQARADRLSSQDLLQFSSTAEQLADVWFSHRTHDSVTERLESFLLQGGMFGTHESRVEAQRTRKGGRWRYILSRLFPSYASMKPQYPILKTCPLFLPVCYVLRAVRMIKGGRLRSTVNEFKASGVVSASQSRQTDELLRSIGL